MAARGLDRKTVILPGIKSTLDVDTGPVLNNATINKTLEIICNTEAEPEAVILTLLAGLGTSANLILMVIIILRGKLRR